MLILKPEQEYLTISNTLQWRLQYARVIEKAGAETGLGEIIELEKTHLYPLLKGSDIGSGKAWRKKFVLVSPVQNAVD